MAVGVVAAMVAVAVAAAAALGLGGGETPPPAASGLPPATDRVMRATLTQTQRVSGRLAYGAAATIIARASAATSTASGGGTTGGSGSGGTGGGNGSGGNGSGGTAQSGAASTPGTLTWLPAVGAVVRPGQAVYRVDDRPVVLLSGRVPMWRVQTVGVEGPDAELLETNLTRFGYTGFTVDSTFTAATARAVKRWQRDLGVPRTGKVDVNQVVVAQGGLRVTGHKAALGAEAVGEMLTYTGTTRVVVVPLDVARQHLVRVGLRAAVTLPNGKRVTGRVASIGTVASAASAGQEGQQGQQESTPTVDVVVTIADQAALGRLDAAPVDLTLVVSRRRNVLTVPVGALVALAEGGYGVQVSTLVVSGGGWWPAELTGLPGRAKQASIGGSSSQGVTTDAHAEPTALARRPAHRVSSLLYRPDVCDLPRHGRRIHGPAGPAHRHRDAGRRPAGRPAPPRPGLPVLRHRPLVG